MNVFGRFFNKTIQLRANLTNSCLMQIRNPVTLPLRQNNFIVCVPVKQPACMTYQSRSYTRTAGLDQTQCTNQRSQRVRILCEFKLHNTLTNVFKIRVAAVKPLTGP